VNITAVFFFVKGENVKYLVQKTGYITTRSINLPRQQISIYLSVYHPQLFRHTRTSSYTKSTTAIMLPLHYFIFTLLTILGFTSTSVCLPTQTLEAQPAPTLSHSLPDTTSMPDSLEERQERNNANPSVFNPPVTAAPDQAEKLASMGWRQTTYYECKTRDGKERCGWHIPVYKAAAQGRRGEIVGWKVVVGIALGLAMLLYGGWW
jgi:hypothetical protein